ncbi:hypothetical protein MtrunA17_Chr1g0167561 [Medicago truncatula]|uniref:Uncharacterized protein n=1 Tax=Medicago truncatula TaxID=3880 RepID=A0A396JV75_MEDTR|nr:hypothetical protein MtrunA17_Chr1g0167561 [Medicago truncatula]
MVLVPANMPHFGFSPCKKNLLFLVLVKSKDFAGTISLINGFSHHVPRVQIITKVEPGTKIKMRHICRDQKQQKKFTVTKTKTRHI